MSIATQHRFRVWTLILSLLVGVCAMAPFGMAQSANDNYKVKVVTPYGATQGEAQEIVVKVRTEHGALAHGIPVRFQLDPEWRGDASITPAETKTAHGMARAYVRTDLTGYVGMTVRVGFNTVIKRSGVHFDANTHHDPGSADN